ncbi:MAG: thiamine-phosphate kinase [Firmicutes bacterium]|nr:thiamine-phosphate kinase [Bacillota bacterium]
MADGGEWQRIAAVAAALGRAGRGGGVAWGIGDDAAVLRPRPGYDLLVTQDALVEDVHFRRRWTTAEDLAHKVLAVSVSDIAAMGGRPRFALVALALPPDVDLAWSEAFGRGLAAAARRFRLAVVGGDTVRSPGPLVADGVVLGEVGRGRARLRAGVRPGDRLVVTGTVGGAGAGLRLLDDPDLARRLPPTLAARARRRLLRPTPRVAAGRALAPAAGALVDLSDGLGGAVAALCRSSPVGVRIHADRVPVDPAAAAVARLLGQDPVDFALAAGEDYELLAAVAPRRAASLPALSPRAVEVGEAVDEAGAWLVRPDGSLSPLPGGYDAFAPPSERR